MSLPWTAADAHPLVVPLGRDESKCPSPGVETELAVRSADGLNEVARASTDADGAFWIPLEPGAYLVEVPQVTPMQIEREVSVTVGPDVATSLTIRIPAGRRTVP